MCPSGRGQVLLPWPNRIEDGAYSFDGRDHRLPLTEPEAGNAIHGLVRWDAWTVRERTAERVVLAHVLHPQPGYPFTLDLEVDYALSADGLTVRTRATNLGPDACPFGAGNHPYLRAGGGLVDDLVLRLPASTVLDADARGIPTGSAPVEERGLDFREPRAIGDDGPRPRLHRARARRRRARARRAPGPRPARASCSGRTRRTATSRSSPATRSRTSLGGASRSSR